MSLVGPSGPSVGPVIGTTSPSRTTKFSRYWLPVLAWAAAIFIGSGDSLSANNTSRFLEPFIHWVFPNLAGQTVDAIMFAIRKGGHLTEYAVLSALCWRAVRQPWNGDSRAWSLRDTGIALVLTAAYAVSDEFHQAFVSSRTASSWDVLLDACGALAGLALIWGVRRVRKPA